MSNKCPCCESVELVQPFIHTSLPASVVQLSKVTGNTKHYQMDLKRCGVCGHIFNAAPPELDYSQGCCMYNAGVSWESHLKRLALQINNKYFDCVCEIGGGDGEFLALLDANRKFNFECDTLAAWSSAPLPASGRVAVVLRHVLEHVPDIRGYWASLRDQALMRYSGEVTFYIEVPNHHTPYAESRFEDYTPEHIHYFNGISMTRLLPRAEIMGDKRILLSVETVKAGGRDAIRLPDICAGSGSRYFKKFDRCVFWGGAGKGATFLNYTGIIRTAAWFDVVDSDLNKVGCYTPGTDIQIKDPATVKEPEIVIITAAWRADDIIKEIRNDLAWTCPVKIYSKGSFIDVKEEA